MSCFVFSLLTPLYHAITMYEQITMATPQRLIVLYTIMSSSSERCPQGLLIICMCEFMGSMDKCPQGIHY